MTGRSIFHAAVGLLLALSICATGQESLAADTNTPAKELFGAMALPAKMPPSSLGFYAKGCLAGGVAIPTDGETWQAMRLSRNRRWGHPLMIDLLERLSKEAAAKDGWPGLLLGDISQPRGGPMISGHASHQIGLDADIWLTPMPKRTLSAQERETIEATSMLKKDSLYVDPAIWTPAHAKLIMRAASYPNVERVFVHPGIKKKLCETWKGDRADLGKVRPIYGHFYHFHVRMTCPPGSKECKGQQPVAAGDGCDKSLAWWFTDEPWAKPGAKPPVKPAKPKYATLSDLPKACRAVLQSPAQDVAAATDRAASDAAAGASIEQIITGSAEPAASIPVPAPRPLR